MTPEDPSPGETLREDAAQQWSYDAGDEPKRLRGAHVECPVSAIFLCVSAIKNSSFHTLSFPYMTICSLLMGKTQQERKWEGGEGDIYKKKPNYKKTPKSYLFIHSPHRKHIRQHHKTHSVQPPRRTTLQRPTKQQHAHGRAATSAHDRSAEEDRQRRQQRGFPTFCLGQLRPEGCRGRLGEQVGAADPDVGCCGV